MDRKGPYATIKDEDTEMDVFESFFKEKYFVTKKGFIYTG